VGIPAGAAVMRVAQRVSRGSACVQPVEESVRGFLSGLFWLFAVG